MDTTDSGQLPRAFSTTLDADGKKKLTDAVKAKLAEVMESYADDVLAVCDTSHSCFPRISPPSPNHAARPDFPVNAS